MDVPDRIHIRGVGFESLAMETEVGFPAPMSHLASNADGFLFWWKMMQFVFELPDPSSYPAYRAGTFSEDDRIVLRRFVDVAKDLAVSDMLNSTQSVTVFLSEGRTEDTFRSNEIIRGFAVTFRQLNAIGEPASFDRVYNLLAARNEVDRDELASLRRQRLLEWKKAECLLREHLLHVLVGLKLADQGLMDPGMIPDKDGRSPAQLISIYQYGDLLHWGRRKDELAAVNADAMWSGVEKMKFLKAAAGLSHLYMGFALLVERAIASA